MHCKYEMIVGLEVHAELKTETKIFCSCKNEYGAPPNTRVCPVCLGMPGVLPRLNRRAVELGITAGLACGCTVSLLSRFDRKNYFYPDLPKGYQITQYDHPLCRDGFLDVETEDGIRRIAVQRMHLEEDAGKLLHGEDGTKVDYNRAGVPLIEIVSAPDIRSSSEARAYLTALRERLLFAGVSDCKMNEGSMRCDVNLSVRLRGSDGFGVRTEIKNINSVVFAAKAIEYEFVRQTEILEAGGEIRPQTRRYDEATGTTVLMREKETAADYRYFPEPDIPPLQLTETDIEAVRRGMPLLADAYRKMFDCHGIAEDLAFQLTQTPDLAGYFRAVCERARHPRIAANLLIGEMLPKGLTLPAESLAAVADMAGEKMISAASARKLLSLCMDGGDPRTVAEKNRMLMLTDPDAVAALVREAAEANPEAVRQYAAGNEKAKQPLIGFVMKKSGGRADPAVLNEMLEKILKSN
ncbi:MAG: Asp-tRNA(Asn)/Glu-tRNA(Gln) amidotransferase subunit GatB [Clostridia bacterium]|nr:Asp-tRNA(Asn)/Glu-tRNA(Gln) amidotransferase subunit GatB [Clostridia bacterium]